MPHDLVLLADSQPGLPAILEGESQLCPRELADARSFMQASKSAATLKAYRSDIRDFEGWCRERGLLSVPATPDTVCAYLAASARAGIRPWSLGRRLAAIAYGHRLAQCEPPTSGEAVKATLAGIRRTYGVTKVQKSPTTSDVLQRMLDTCPADTLKGKRDRALLVLGFAAALRRSELVALTVEDLGRVSDGYRLMVRRSKTDQTGEGAEIAVPHGFKLRPVEVVEAWLEAAGITTGLIFVEIKKGGRIEPNALSDRSVAAIVKAAVARAGLDPVSFSGHSLRAGFVTSAAESDASIIKIQEVSRHVSVAVLTGYVRRKNLFSGRWPLCPTRDEASVSCATPAGRIAFATSSACLC